VSRRGWLVLGAAVVVLATTAGTGAFSTVGAERGVQVAVVDDDNAYLGVVIAANATGNDTTANITVTNQFPDGTTLTSITATGPDGTTSLTPNDGALETGETTSATIQNATCDSTITIHANGPGVQVTIDRPVDCT
jgi:hypothetical protein